MRIASVRIRNFRSLVDVRLPLSRGTVIIGENNTGKSAVVDALRFVLSRPGARRIQPAEYDFHLPDPKTDPRAGDGIIVEVVFREEMPDEWPDEAIQELLPVIQTDVANDIRSVYLRYTYRYNPKTKAFDALWAFTNAKGEELKGKGVLGSAAMPILYRTVPLFYLSALRDVTDEFGTRSQFWGRLLRTLSIPEAEHAEIQAQLEQINARILAADPRLKNVTNTLDQLQHVVATATKDAVSVRALPLRIWDLLERADIVLRAKNTATSFPLVRHGQGVQSLAVLFLFQAFVEHLLTESYAKYSEPLLALEEPEAHLHPQAARALWSRIEALPGQKLITSHSPYFVQHVPFRKLIVLRRAGAQTRACWLPSSFEVALPDTPELRAFVKKRAAKFSYDTESRILHVRGTVDEGECKGLMACFVDPGTRAAHHAAVRALQKRSQSFVTDDELAQLETFARRIRGEILFSRVWLLCEGQSDYVILRAMAEAMKTPFDSHGVSVIDYQNSGSPGAFVALARALEFPWFMVCDNDTGGADQVAQVKSKGVSDQDVQQRVTMLPKYDIEGYLAERFSAELGPIAAKLGAKIGAAPGTPEFPLELAEFLRTKKTEYAGHFAELVSKWDASRVPEPLATVIKNCIEAANA